jgi:hypothetical protein
MRREKEKKKKKKDCFLPPAAWRAGDAAAG